MNNLNLSELSPSDLIQINGGVDQVAYDAGYSAGQMVGKMVKNFLTLSGIARFLGLL
jgi:hypothetical protein